MGGFELSFSVTARLHFSWMGRWRSSVLHSDSGTGLPHTQHVTDDNLSSIFSPHAYTSQCRYGNFAMTVRRTAETSPRSFGRSPHPTQLLLEGLFQRIDGREPTTREQTAEGGPALWQIAEGPNDVLGCCPEYSLIPATKASRHAREWRALALPCSQLTRHSV